MLFAAGWGLIRNSSTKFTKKHEEILLVFFVIIRVLCGRFLFTQRSESE